MQAFTSLASSALALGLALHFSSPAAAQQCNSAAHPSVAAVAAPRAESSILDTAVAAGKFKTLAAAIGAAGLAEALGGPGPFTVFAPSDEAFAKLPKGTLESLLLPENKERLVALLKYHVVPGKVLAAQVVTLRGALTLNGQRLDLDTTAGVRVDAANVVQADLGCTNGVIHVVDSVLLPAERDLAATADAAGSFKTLVAAARAAGLLETLQKGGPFTVFAPSDAAFARLPAGALDDLLRPENKQRLVDLLKRHIVTGRVYSEAVVGLKEATTLGGAKLPVRVDKAGVFLAGTKVVSTDIDASNGVIHVIDAVLLPPQ